jgi:Bacteriophage probable baseplate hub protein
MSQAEGHLVPAFAIRLNGQQLRGENADNISRIEVSQEPNTLDHLRLTLANDDPSFVQTIGTHRGQSLFALFKEGAEIVLSLGYGSDLTTVFDGEITAIEATFPEDGAATVDVHCHSFLHRLSRSVVTNTFVKLKDSAIAMQIGQAAGLRVQTRDSKLTHPFVLQYNQTNLEFLLERASLIGYELLANGKTLVFRPATDETDPVATLAYAAATNPLLSVSLREEVLGQGGKVTVRAVDPIKGDLILGSAAADAELEPATTQLRSGPSVSRRVFGAADHVVVDRPLASKAEADALAKSILNGRARSFVTGSGRSLGLPALRAGGVVRLQGLGQKFNGSYYVLQSTHTLSEDGYMTSFRVRRNAVG